MSTRPAGMFSTPRTSGRKYGTRSRLAIEYATFASSGWNPHGSNPSSFSSSGRRSIARATRGSTIAPNDLGKNAMPGRPGVRQDLHASQPDGDRRLASPARAGSGYPPRPHSYTEAGDERVSRGLGIRLDAPQPRRL